MPNLMRCPFCGQLQDEPAGVKSCSRCGGGLEYEVKPPPSKQTYLQVQMELDQIAAAAEMNVERYLLITIRTPKQVPSEEAAPIESGRPPLSFAAVLDVSGSMRGEKISQAKTAVRQAVQYLRPRDVFSLVTFADTVLCPFEPDPIQTDTYLVVESALQRMVASGSTALCAGLETGIEKVQVHPQDTNLVLLLSDGQANVGETDLEKIGARALRARQQGSLVSCIGVGLDYNEALMAEIATQGGGRFYHVLRADQVPAYLAGELGEVAALAARDAKIHLEVPAGATLVPLSAAYPVRQEGSRAVVSVGDIPCDSELEIPLRLALLAQPAGSKRSIEGLLTFRSPAGHDLECLVNRVTVRFEARETFELRQGVVRPVAERVLVQLKASSVLGIARARAYSPATAEQETVTNLASLARYANLLGEERADQEVKELREQFTVQAASPAAAKSAVAAAHRVHRASKDFGKPK